MYFSIDLTSLPNTSFPDLPTESFIMKYDGPHGDYFQELISKGYYFTGAQSTVTTSFLYVLSLLHLVHVLAGMIVLIVVYLNNKKNKYKEEKLGFELAETFWHFLGFLWLYLFVFLYFFR